MSRFLLPRGGQLLCRLLRHTPQKRCFTAPLSRQEIFAKYPIVESAGAKVREARLEHLGHDDSDEDSSSCQLVPLHPDIWSVRPRIDLIQQNVEWQALYKKVPDYL